MAHPPVSSTPKGESITCSGPKILKAGHFDEKIEHDETTDDERIGDGGVKLSGDDLSKDSDVVAHLKGEGCLHNESTSSDDDSCDKSGTRPDHVNRKTEGGHNESHRGSRNRPDDVDCKDEGGRHDVDRKNEGGDGKSRSESGNRLENVMREVESGHNECRDKSRNRPDIVDCKDEGGHSNAERKNEGGHHDVDSKNEGSHHDFCHQDFDRENEGGHHDVGHHDFDRKNKGGHHDVGHHDFDRKNDVSHHDVGHHNFNRKNQGDHNESRGESGSQPSNVNRKNEGGNHESRGKSKTRPDGVDRNNEGADDESCGEGGSRPDHIDRKNGSADNLDGEHEGSDLDGLLVLSKRGVEITEAYSSARSDAFRKLETALRKAGGRAIKEETSVEKGITEEIAPHGSQGRWYKKAEEILTVAREAPIQPQAKGKRRRERKRPIFTDPILTTHLTFAPPHSAVNTKPSIPVQPGQQHRNLSFRHSAYLSLNLAAGTQVQSTLSPTAQEFIPSSLAKVRATGDTSKSLTKPQSVSKIQPRKHCFRSSLQSEKHKFARAIKQWSHMGINKSPFLPQTLQEWLEVKAATAADKQKLAEKKLATKEAERLAGVKINPCMGGKTFESPGTAVLGLPSIWGPDRGDERSHADWPTALEMKFEGDDRAKSGFGRFLPLPRANEFDTRLLGGNGTVTWDGVGRVPWGERKLKEVEKLDRVWGSEGMEVDGERIYGKAFEIDDAEAELLLGKELMRCLNMDEDENENETETKTDATGK